MSIDREVVKEWCPIRHPSESDSSYADRIWHVGICAKCRHARKYFEEVNSKKILRAACIVQQDLVVKYPKIPTWCFAFSRDAT